MTRFLRGATVCTLALALGLTALAGCEAKPTPSSTAGDKMGDGKMGDGKMGDGKMGDGKMGDGKMGMSTSK